MDYSISIQAILYAIIVGAIVGLLARLLVPGRQHLSILTTIVIGIVAAVLGTLLASALGVSYTHAVAGIRGIDWAQLLVQVVLAAIGIVLYTGRGHRSRRRS